MSSILTSCTVLKTSTSKTMDIYGAGVIQKPVLVDLDVKEIKVTGTATARSGTSLEIVKQDAVANALKTANADVLVEPKFETATTSERVTATVTGFPATYKNFRPIKPEDVQMLQVGVTQKANVYEPPVQKQKKKGVGAAIGAILSVVLLLLLIPK